MTTDQVTTRGQDVLIRLGSDDVLTPEPLARLLLELVRQGRSHVGVGSPATTGWLFPGGLPGRPLTGSSLGERLRRLGIRAQTARRATLTQLAAQVPAAVLADLLGLSPGAAVKWVHETGGDWARYAAQVARSRDHQTRRMPLPTRPR